MLTTFQRLEVDCVVQGQADRLVTLANGQHVCLHFQTVLKSADDPFDDSFWLRLGTLINRPPRYPGEATCFHSLGVRDVVHPFDEIAKEQEHSYRTVVWWARRGMNDDYPELSLPDFQMRMAEDIDHQMAELERRLSGTLDTLPCYLPSELKGYGLPGGYLQSVKT